MYSLFNNLENKVIAELKSTSDLLDKMKKIAFENEHFDFSFISISDVQEYIEDYCDNLKLLQDSEVDKFLDSQDIKVEKNEPLNSLYCSTGTNIYKLEVTDIDINNVIFFTIKFKNGAQKKSSITQSRLDTISNYNSICGGYIFKTKKEATNHALTRLKFKEDALYNTLYKQLEIITKQRENIIREDQTI
jgi:hypothetical protein